MEHLSAETRIGHLLFVRTRDRVLTLRFQNYQPGQTIAWDGQAYDYAGFQYSGSSRSLESQNTSATVTIANTPLIRSHVNLRDGLRGAIVRITSIYPDSPNQPVVTERMQIAAPEFTEAAIVFQLESLLDAIQGTVPTVRFDLRRVPELPSRISAELR